MKGAHDLNYRFTHAIDAKGKERECAVCHEPASFCTECHRPESDPAFFRPPWHGGSDWGAIAGAVGSGGGRHAVLARRDMERCAACHDLQGEDDLAAIESDRGSLRAVSRIRDEGMTRFIGITSQL